MPRAGKVNISRSLDEVLPANVTPDRVPPQSATDILPYQKSKSIFLPELQFKDAHSVIAVRVQSCDAADPSSYATCGLVVEDNGVCKCWNYVSPYNLGGATWVTKFLDILRVSRPL